MVTQEIKKQTTNEETTLCYMTILPEWNNDCHELAAEQMAAQGMEFLLAVSPDRAKNVEPRPAAWLHWLHLPLRHEASNTCGLSRDSVDAIRCHCLLLEQTRESSPHARGGVEMDCTYIH
jgi:hypothetical protein